MIIDREKDAIYVGATQAQAKGHIPPSLVGRMDTSHTCASCGEPLVVMRETLTKVIRAHTLHGRRTVIMCDRCGTAENPDVVFEFHDPDFTRQMNRYRASKN